MPWLPSQFAARDASTTAHLRLQPERLRRDEALKQLLAVQQLRLHLSQQTLSGLWEHMTVQISAYGYAAVSGVGLHNLQAGHVSNINRQHLLPLRFGQLASELSDPRAALVLPLPLLRAVLALQGR